MHIMGVRVDGGHMIGMLALQSQFHCYEGFHHESSYF